MTANIPGTISFRDFSWSENHLCSINRPQSADRILYQYESRPLSVQQTLAIDFVNFTRTAFIRCCCTHVQYSIADHLFNMEKQMKLRIYHWVTITVAVVLLHPRGGSGSPSEMLNNAGEVSSMIHIDLVLSIIGITIAAVGLGLQIASYINTKVDRSLSDKR